jgi:predicted dehydrogenase
MQRREFLHTMGQAAGAMSAAAWSGSSLLAAAEAKPRIKVGQIGASHAHASGKLEAMCKLSEIYEVVGVVEPSAERRDKLSSQPPYQGLKWLTEEELLATPDLKAVAVETAVRELVPTAARCVAAGKHVHVDKPAGESLSAFKKLLDAATSQGVTVQMGYMFRYNPAFQLCFQAVREGWLGQVFEVHGVISKTLPAGARRQLAEYRGGSMFELGCHLIDMLVTILGKPDKVTPHLRRTRPQQDDLADNMLAVFDYPLATATIRSSLLEVDGGRRRHFTVCGDRGTIEIYPLEPPQLRLTLDQPRGAFKKGTQEVTLPRMSGRYDGEFSDLAAVIRAEKPFGWPPAHDLATHEAVLRASGLDLS